MSLEKLLKDSGLGGERSASATGRFADHGFVRDTIARAGVAVREAVVKASPVTHIGTGKAKVDRVASNRRVLGADGQVTLFRMTAWTMAPHIYESLRERSAREGYRISPDHPEEAQAAPEGVIDPYVRILSFWNGDEPLVSVSYYATHPQSYYGYGDISADIPGLARAQREQSTGVRHIHFNGAGGNLGAGKYNDGSPEARRALTERLADGMRRAWEQTEKRPVTAAEVDWRVVPVEIPPKYGDAAALERTLLDTSRPMMERRMAATRLDFLRRIRREGLVELSALRLGHAYLVHMPGELFVEYQLAAQALRPDDFVCMAAYGEGLGYIGTEAAYAEKGYETQGASRTAPQVEAVLMSGVRELLR